MMMMVKRVVIQIVAIAILCAASSAQNFRSYIDESFNDISKWRQTGDGFYNNEGLISDSSTTYGTDIIWRNVDGFIPEQGSTNWKITMQCGFDNSSVNNFQFYLVANGSDPDDEDFHGIAIGTGFKPDYKSISLIYRHNGTTDVLANTGIAVGKNKDFSLQISQSSAGAWSIDGSVVYTPKKPSAMLSNCVAVAFTFNKNGAGKFSFKFEEFGQGNDATFIKPGIDSAAILSPTILRLYTSGRLDEQTVYDTNNYIVGGSHPKSVAFGFYNIDLHYPDTIPNVGEIALEVSGLKDVNGYDAGSYSHNFRQALQDEIVINEIMCDVNPAPFSLPAKKFVELYNTTKNDYNIDGYVFRIGDSEYEISGVTSNANEYLLLASDTTTFARYAKCAQAMQESKLTVAGKHIELVNKLGRVVDSLSYSDELYNDPNRNSGGFSMERLDPFNNCTGADNWHASSDLSGGTPGRQNSVFKIYVDETVPQLVGNELLANSVVRLDFTEKIGVADFTVNNTKPTSVAIDNQSVTLTMPSILKNGTNKIEGRAVDVCGTESGNIKTQVEYTPLKVESLYAVSSYQVLVNFTTAVTNVENEFFTLENGAMPSLSEPLTDGSNSLLLTFADDFEQDSKHTIKIDGVENTIHDKISGESNTFKYHRAEAGDIIINEVLYHPAVGMKRYVELFNNSGDDIFMFGLVLSAYTANGALLRSCVIDGYKMLEADGFAVATADTASVALNYNARGMFVESSRFPALNTSKGYISLRTADGVLLDSMYYDNSMHSNVLSTTRGVALERISADEPSLDAENWTSASELYNFATPGFHNSCTQDASDSMDDHNIALSDEAVTIENRLFHPGDEECEFKMVFNFGRPTDPLLSVTVHDDNGRKVRSLVSEVLAYPGSSVSWDGRDDSGSRCRTGIYIVLVKAIDESGWSFVKKEVCVIGAMN